MEGPAGSSHLPLNWLWIIQEAEVEGGIRIDGTQEQDRSKEEVWAP